MYSITSRDTFEAALAILDHVIENLREHARFTPFMLVGNKTDLERYRYLDKSYIFKHNQSCVIRQLAVQLIEK